MKKQFIPHRIASLALVAAIGICGSVFWGQARSDALTQSGDLKEATMPPPSGLLSNKTSLSGGPTGSIGFSEAMSSDCNVSASLMRNWIASDLSYYVNSFSKPNRYLLLCVTLMKSPMAAKANVRNVETAAKMHSFHFVRGAFTVQVGPATLVAFEAGRFFIFIAGLDQKDQRPAHILDRFVVAQFHRAVSVKIRKSSSESP